MSDDDTESSASTASSDESEVATMISAKSGSAQALAHPSISYNTSVLSPCLLVGMRMESTLEKLKAVYRLQPAAMRQVFL